MEARRSSMRRVQKRRCGPSRAVQLGFSDLKIPFSARVPPDPSANLARRLCRLGKQHHPFNRNLSVHAPRTQPSRVRSARPAQDASGTASDGLGIPAPPPPPAAATCLPVRTGANYPELSRLQRAANHHARRITTSVATYRWMLRRARVTAARGARRSSPRGRDGRLDGVIG